MSDLLAAQPAAETNLRRVSMLFNDQRVLLGLLLFLLATFVGGALGTTSILYLWVTTGVVVVAVRTFRSNQERNLLARRHWFWRLVVFLLSSLGIMGVLYVVVLWRFTTRLSNTTNVLALAVDTIGHATMMLAIICWCWRPRHGHVLMMPLGMIAILMGVSAGGVSSTTVGQTVLGLATCLGFVVAAQVILSPASAQLSRQRLPYQLLVLSMLLISTSVVLRGVQAALPLVQTRLLAQLKDQLEDVSSIGLPANGRYVRGDRLGNVRDNMLRYPEGIALRGYCDSPPGYLRGNVFDGYRAGHWVARRRWPFGVLGSRLDGGRTRWVKQFQDASVPLNEPANPNRVRFQLQGAEVSDDRTAVMQNGRFVSVLEIHGQPEMGPQVFLPATTRWIEARGSELRLTPHGLVRGGIDTTQPWVAGVFERNQQESLSARDRGILLWVEPSIREEINGLSGRICRNAKSTNEKVQRITSFFQDNYEYTLDTEAPPQGVDPIVHFLRKRHPAHCELFASAATLMLRTQDVPTRYVTGYVMNSMNDGLDYYLARNRDAHAWLEYYDEESQRWLAAEPTPGRRYHTLVAESESQTTSLDGTSETDFQERQNGWLPQIWGRLSSLRATDALVLLFRILQVPLLLALIIWLWRNQGNATQVDPVAHQLRVALRRMDRQIARQGWFRLPSETLHQFAARLDAGAEESGKESSATSLRQAAAWYRNHARDLYRGPRLAEES